MNSKEWKENKNEEVEGKKTRIKNENPYLAVQITKQQSISMSASYQVIYKIEYKYIYALSFSAITKKKEKICIEFDDEQTSERTNAIYILEIFYIYLIFV